MVSTTLEMICHQDQHLERLMALEIESIHFIIKLDRDNYYYWQTIISNNEEKYTDICWWTLRQLMDRMLEWRCCDCSQLGKVVQYHNSHGHQHDDTILRNKDHILLPSHSDDRMQIKKDYKLLFDYLKDKDCNISIDLRQQWIDCPWLLIQWSQRLLPHINITQRLNDAMAILSTLGGAYSALGDHFDHFVSCLYTQHTNHTVNLRFCLLYSQSKCSQTPSIIPLISLHLAIDTTSTTCCSP